MVGKKRKHGWQSIREFVSEGVMLALPLCFPGESVPPPAGETAMNVLALDPTGTVYCGTCGARAHVLAAVIHQDSGIIHDLGVVPGATSVDGLMVHEDSLIVAASGPDGSAIWKTERFYGTFLIQEWGLARSSFEKVCDIAPDERIAHAIAGRNSDEMLGLTATSGKVFRVDLSDRGVHTLGELSRHERWAPQVALDRVGRLWGSCGAARLWWCDVASELLEVTHLVVPGAAGRAQHTQVSAWALDSLSGAFYAGTLPDGFLFTFDPETFQVKALGKPCRQDWVTCLAIGNDGRVFGMAGAEDDIGHLFCYDPVDGSLRDLGIPVSTLTARQYGYHYRCAVAGQGGEIYFGQHERVNHLWVYFPAIRRQDSARPSSS